VNRPAAARPRSWRENRRTRRWCAGRRSGRARRRCTCVRARMWASNRSVSTRRCRSAIGGPCHRNRELRLAPPEPQTKGASRETNYVRGIRCAKSDGDADGDARRACDVEVPNEPNAVRRLVWKLKRDAKCVACVSRRRTVRRQATLLTACVRTRAFLECRLAPPGSGD
jgi:hypothetical protein